MKPFKGMAKMQRLRMRLKNSSFSIYGSASKMKTIFYNEFDKSYFGTKYNNQMVHFALRNLSSN